MATLEAVVNQAIADFDSIKSAIEAKGVEVPDGTDTSQYGALIAKIFTAKNYYDPNTYIDSTATVSEDGGVIIGRTGLGSPYTWYARPTLPKGTYTISIYGFDAMSVYFTANWKRTITLESETEVELMFEGYAEDGNYTTPIYVMINEGSAAKPFAPYGV